MAFDGRIITLAWLVKFELPAHTIRWCDGGQVIWSAETYRSEDSIFGTLAAADLANETIGDEAPGLSLVILPKSTAAAAELSSPEFQGSRVRIWLAEVDRSTGAVDGTPELVADLELDTTKLIVGVRDRRLEVGLISIAERLFNINEGNVLSTRFHQTVWPGELGFDNATGSPVTKAWGVQGARGQVGGSGGTAGGSASGSPGSGPGYNGTVINYV